MVYAAHHAEPAPTPRATPHAPPACMQGVLGPLLVHTASTAECVPQLAGAQQMVCAAHHANTSSTAGVVDALATLLGAGEGVALRGSLLRGDGGEHSRGAEQCTPAEQLCGQLAQRSHEAREVLAMCAATQRGRLRSLKAHVREAQGDVERQALLESAMDQANLELQYACEPHAVVLDSDRRLSKTTERTICPPRVSAARPFSWDLVTNLPGGAQINLKSFNSSVALYPVVYNVAGEGDCLFIAYMLGWLLDIARNELARVELLSVVERISRGTDGTYVVNYEAVARVASLICEHAVRNGVREAEILVLRLMRDPGSVRTFIDWLRAVTALAVTSTYDYTLPDAEYKARVLAAAATPGCEAEFIHIVILANLIGHTAEVICFDDGSGGSVRVAGRGGEDRVAFRLLFIMARGHYALLSAEEAQRPEHSSTTVASVSPHIVGECVAWTDRPR